MSKFERITRPIPHRKYGLCVMFENLNRDWFKLLPVFFRIQRYFHERDTERNFVIVPQTSFQRRHILIDTVTLRALHSQLGMLEKSNGKNMAPEDYIRNQHRVWRDFLKHDEINSIKDCSHAHKVFDHSIITDGLAMSLSCQKKIPDEEMTEELNIKKCRKRYEDNHYKKFKAFDPGFRLTLGGISRKAGSTVERNIRVKCGKYYRLTHEHRRRKAKEKIDGNLQSDMRADREDEQRYDEVPSCKR